MGRRRTAQREWQIGILRQAVAKRRRGLARERIHDGSDISETLSSRSGAARRGDLDAIYRSPSTKTRRLQLEVPPRLLQLGMTNGRCSQNRSLGTAADGGCFFSLARSPSPPPHRVASGNLSCPPRGRAAVGGHVRPTPVSPGKKSARKTWPGRSRTRRSPPFTPPV